MVDKANDAPATKHPETIIVDQSPASQRHQLNGGASSIDHTNNVNNKFYRQRDLYPNAAAGPGQEFSSIDLVNRPQVMGNLYFENDKVQMAQADSKSTNVDVTHTEHDAGQYNKQLASKVFALLTDPNAGMDIAIVGHASTTGTAQHNQVLSDQRAQAEGEALKAELTALAVSKNMDPAKVLAHVKIVPQGKGDTDLAIPMDGANAANRGVEVMAIPQDDGRAYRVVHLAAHDVQQLQQGSNHYVYDLGGQTDLGKSIVDKFAKQSPQPAHGSLVLDTAGMTKPIDLNLSVGQGNDVRLLVNDPSASVRYVMTSAHDVTVFANEQPVANLHYAIAGNKPLQQQDINVGTVDAKGHTSVAIGSVDMHDVAQSLANRIDADHDGKITKAELENYQKISAKAEKVYGDAQGLHVDHAYKGVALSKELSNGTSTLVDASGFISNDQTATVLGGKNKVGELVATRDDMNDFKNRNELLAQMLEKANFQLPASGNISVAKFENDAAHIAAPAGQVASVQPTGKGNGR